MGWGCATWTSSRRTYAWQAGEKQQGLSAGCAVLALLLLAALDCLAAHVSAARGNLLYFSGGLCRAADWPIKLIDFSLAAFFNAPMASNGGL